VVANRFSWLAWGVGVSVALVQPVALAKSAVEVNDIAQAIAVKIATTDGNGSGILLQRQGDVYTVVTSPNTSLMPTARLRERVGMGFSSEIPQNLYDFLGGIIGNRTNYFDVTFTAFYSGEHVQPHSLDVDTSIDVPVNQKF
jgi:hypothetical protein